MKVFVLHEVAVERERQEQLKASGKFLWTCADNEVTLVTDNGRSETVRKILDSEKLAVLSEEFGEAAREVTEEIIAKDRQDGALANQSLVKLRKELIQVAAVAVAWVESLDARGVK